MASFRLRDQSQVIPGILAVVALLWFGKPFLMPLALSVLIAFLLVPCVTWMERRGMPHKWAAVFTTFVAFVIIGCTLAIAAVQIVDLTKSIPLYKENLIAKAVEFRGTGDGPFNKLVATFKEVSAEVSRKETREVLRKDQPKADPDPVPVEIVDSKSSVINMVTSLGGSLLETVASAALVLITVAFILIERRDLRDRFIHLVGSSRLRITTQAIDEAGERVSRYLFAQSMVNASYGLVFGFGLHMIGIPNAALWGIFAAAARFIPYAGALAGLAFPLLISIAFKPGWMAPVETVCLFLLLELISNNVVEPWLYGSSTGLSSTAIIVSAAFWTCLWGAGGLLLSTPLAVVMAVLGKYVQRLSFLDVILGDKPPIEPEQRFYQRLLAGDESELFEMVSGYVSRNETARLFDNLIIPALHRVEIDQSEGVVTRDECAEMLDRVRDALNSIDGFVTTTPVDTMATVWLIPARTEGDHLAALMLAHLLTRDGIVSNVSSHQTLAGEFGLQTGEADLRWLCLSALSVNSAKSGAGLIRRLRGSEHRRAILGWWGIAGADTEEGMGKIELFRSLREASKCLAERAPTPVPEGEAAP